MSAAVKVDSFVVEQVRDLSESSYIVRFSGGGMQFVPGQHISLGIKGSSEHREYSIYSSDRDESLEVLIKQVDDGMVSKQLRALKPGDELEVKGPFGFFLADARAHAGQKLLFIASGTGIAPFHSFILSNPKADYRLIHGIRNFDEAYEKDQYDSDRYFTCTSRGDRGDFQGRITDYLQTGAEEKADKVYLCGNSNMIYDAMDVLKSQGYRHDQLFTEVYF